MLAYLLNHLGDGKPDHQPMPPVTTLLNHLGDGIPDSVKVSRSLKGSVAGETVPAAANPLISNAQLEIIDKLSKAGMLGGANASKD